MGVMCVGGGGGVQCSWRARRHLASNLPNVFGDKSCSSERHKKDGAVMINSEEQSDEGGDRGESV